MTPERLEAGEVVYTRVYALETAPGRPLDLMTASIRTGFEPHEVVVDAGDRLTVRSLTTRRFRVISRSELA